MSAPERSTSVYGLRGRSRYLHGYIVANEKDTGRHCGRQATVATSANYRCKRKRYELTLTTDCGNQHQLSLATKNVGWGMEEVRRGRPRKPGGPMSSTERSRLYRQRQQEERERLEAELEFVNGGFFDSLESDGDQEGAVDEELEQLRESNRQYEKENEQLALAVVRLLNWISTVNLEVAQDCLADKFIQEILIKFELYMQPGPRAFTQPRFGEYVESETATTLTTESYRNETIIVVPETDIAKD